MVYAAAVEHLDASQRGELDAALDVAAWPRAGETPAQTAAAVAARGGVPAWWHGEEEASQSFLAGLGLSAAALDRLTQATAPAEEASS